MQPPRPEKRPVVHRHHGDERVDEWHWLRDRTDPAVIAHLEAENAYTEAVLAHTAALQGAIFDEIKARTVEDDDTVPCRKGAHEYWVRSVEGRQYRLHMRRRAGDGEDEGVTILDGNELAGASEFFALRSFAVSPDGSRLAYATDHTGDEHCVLRVRDLEALRDHDVIEDTVEQAAWAGPDALVYLRADPAHRPHQVWLHRVGTDPAGDVLLHQEHDERFYLSVRTTRTGRFVVVDARSKVSREVRTLDTTRIDQGLVVFEPRADGVEYTVEHQGDRFLVTANIDGAVDWALYETPLDSTARASWRLVTPHRPGTRLYDVLGFAGHYVRVERADGVRRLVVVDAATGDERPVEAPEPVGTATPVDNHVYETATLRLEYQSLVMPPTVFDVDMASGALTMLKQQEVRGYDPQDYETGREWATAADGTAVPITIVARRDTPRDGSAPCLLYGYGSYEASIDPVFGPPRLSLLDRGFVFAIAHIRGGGELGRRWYEDGKLLRKRNTFTDFISCAEHLVGAGFTAPDRLAIRGASAGGLLMGAVTNLRPDLFAAVVAQVPFVDSLNTMLDPTLPLTVVEYDEWGNPGEPASYEYMKSYAPYENVTVGATYPAILATAGLNDPRVSYWEPAKWVARIRDRAPGPDPVLLLTKLGAGHGGASGRYDAWRDEALLLAFVIDRVGAQALGSKRP